MNYRKCNSTNITFFKRIHEGKKVKQFHYGVKCLNCGVSYKIPRTKEVYELVKNIPWTKSKHWYKLRLVKGTAEGEYKSV